MLFVAFVAVALTGVIGVGLKLLLTYLVRRNAIYGDKQITWSEYGVAMVLISIIVVPSVIGIGTSMSVDQQLRHEELRSTVEKSADIHPTKCHSGQAGNSASSGLSNCSYSYVSGSYSWQEEYTTTEYTTNSKGELVSTLVTKCCITETANIYTPYATWEYTFSVTDWFGTTHTYPTVYLAHQPQQFDGNKAIPDTIQRGAPSDWEEAKRRIDAGDPRPVVGIFTYDNPVIASQEETLAPFSNDVQVYLDKGLLPDHTANILDNPIYGDARKQAKRLSFVGASLPNEDAWQEALMRFNAALGPKLQGDLHVVIADSAIIDDPHRYSKALRAYWLGPHFGKRVLAKNGIILVIGTKEGKVDWATMDTGMPFGNNIMIETAQNLLPRKILTPDIIFGKPRTVITPAAKEGEDDSVQVTLSTPRGVLEEVIFEGASKFKRSCMKCEDPEDAGSVGYKDLIAQIEPPTSTKVWMVVIASLLSLPFWGFVAGTSYLEVEYWRRRRAVPTSRIPRSNYAHYR